MLDLAPRTLSYWTCRHKWLTFAQVVKLYAGCEATAKAVCQGVPERPRPQAPKEEAAKQYYVLEYGCATKEDEAREGVEGRLAGEMDKGAFEALVENKAFSADNVGSDGGSSRKRKKPKLEREETDCEKAKKTVKAMAAKVGRPGTACA